ncbi:lisH domain-containing protein ARMC9-like [Ornithodoros turicata]|uniref:lisH domain-containing protein ARMC9-like n=1 Tax=Ornithodoros turicata TaxID=34597 RepID=UPI003139C7C8
MSGTVSSVEGELNAIVKEYIVYLGLDELSKLFDEECQKNNRPIQDSFCGSYRGERMRKIQNELLRLFHEGNHGQFFPMWDACISTNIDEGNSAARSSMLKLEFQLRVHFAVFPLRRSEDVAKEEVESAMFQFQRYLEARGAMLGDIKEFLVYCALPYLPNPRLHPSFEEVFKESWIEELQIKVEDFVREALKDTSRNCLQPRLLSLYYCNDMELNDLREEFRQLENRYRDTEKQHMAQRKQLTKLQEDYRKLTNVTADLITAVETVVRGDMVDIDEILSSCDKHFPEMLQAPRSQSHLSIDESLSRVQQLRSILSRQSSIDTDNPLQKFNYTRIKQDLLSGDIIRKCFLLQALRWKITKPPTFEKRDAVVQAFVNNDLLGLEAQQSEYCDRILHMVRSANSNLQQTFTRFLNAFASFSKGRTYLSKSSRLLSILTDSLINGHYLSTTAHDMMLGTLQKLSLRRPLQEFMINEGILEWAVKRLENTDVLTDYSLEYAIALFMNLCLQSSGKERCLQMVRPTLLVLKKLLMLDNAEILPYVNGALYSLLSKEDIRQAALEMDMEADLQGLMNASQPEIRKQVEFVLNKLTSYNDSGDIAQNSNPGSGSEDDDDDDEESEIEPEIDSKDPIEAMSNEMHGEHLLKLCYTEESRPQTVIRHGGNNSRMNMSSGRSLQMSSSPKLADSLSETSNSANESLPQSDLDEGERTLHSRCSCTRFMLSIFQKQPLCSRRRYFRQLSLKSPWNNADKLQ